MSSNELNKSKHNIMKITQQEWTRRNFLVSLAGASSAIILTPFSSWANDEIDSRVAGIVAKTMSIDSHNHIDVPLNSEQPMPKFDFLADFKKSGLSAICMTFAVDYQPLKNTGDAYSKFINGLDATDKLLKENDLKRSLNLADWKTSYKNKKLGVVQSVEGGHFLEGQIDRLQMAYDRGLRMLGLLHDNDASVPLGDIYTKPPTYGGLTQFGGDVIKECNKLGILIDLTHCSNKTIDDALKITTKPIIISHTGLDTQLGKNEKVAQMMKPRLISKEQAKIVANSGGIIGAWRHLTDTPLEYAQNIRTLVDIIGVDNVCIGTDTKMSRAAENKNPFRLGEYTNQIWQNQEQGYFYVVVDALLKIGFSEKEIIKIAGSNFCRVFDAATKKN
jgi:membrane dipeptidase